MSSANYHRPYHHSPAPAPAPAPAGDSGANPAADLATDRTPVTVPPPRQRATARAFLARFNCLGRARSIAGEPDSPALFASQTPTTGDAVLSEANQLTAQLGAQERVAQYMQVGPDVHRGYLDLSGLGLNSLPPNLPTSVTCLNLDGNFFTDLPQGLPAGLLTLRLDNNGLRRLSGSLPTALRGFYIDRNCLDYLPDTLPASITRISARVNRLTMLPATLPAALTSCDFSDNQLDSLPDNLPAGLITLDAARNRLRRLPNQLPPMLGSLNASGNNIHVLPGSWPRFLETLLLRDNQIATTPTAFVVTMPGIRVVDLRTNPLTHFSRQNLRTELAAIRAMGGALPEVLLSPEVRNAHVAAVQSLRSVIDQWHMEHAPEAAASWDAFQGETGAAAFALFLTRLRENVNYTSADFKEKIVEWLGQLAGDTGLRAATFDEAINASNTCEDRITVTLNAMRAVQITHEVTTGKYDRNLEQLVGLARGIFRLEKLEAAARKFVAANQTVAHEEVEVVLGMQVELRERLDLPIDTFAMRFFRCSMLQEADLQVAEQQVKVAENAEFPAFLTAWEPRQSVLTRLDPSGYEAMEDAHITAIETDFNHRMAALYAAETAANVANELRSTGADLNRMMGHEFRHPLTLAILGRNALLTLLAPRW